jgi:ATP/maltotriose-dependent transcriptional regulator MalT
MGPNDTARLLEAGQRSLEAGDWSGARRSFQAVLEESAVAEAFHGLGEALWWLGEMAGTIANYERAYVAFRRRPDLLLAAAVALRIGFHSLAHLSNPAAAAGWIARAERLIREHRLEPLQGELRLMQAYCAQDHARGERFAREALEFAREADDQDLELCALSQLGVRLVEQGRFDDGIPLLDESMAGALGGEAGRLETVVFTSCNMMVSCARCAAFERAMQWVRAADRFAKQYGCPFLAVECRTVYGAVLVATGDWDAAERELRAAIGLSQGSVPAYHAQAVSSLAALRLAQGRLEEAERLVQGYEGHDATVPILAELQLRQGRPTLAITTARRRLDVLEDGRLEGALLLELVGEAEIALGAFDAAADRGRALSELGANHGCRMIVARGKRLWGRALAERGAGEAKRHLIEAHAEFVRLNMPYDAARTRLVLASAVSALDAETAVEEAYAARVVFEQLGAVRDADAAAALLRRLGRNVVRGGSRGLEPLSGREQEVFTLLGEGLSNPQIAERLFISRKTVEHHVSRILARLRLANRAEAAARAAAEAVLRLTEESGTE